MVYLSSMTLKNVVYISLQHQSVFTTDNGSLPEYNQLMPTECFTYIDVSEADFLSAIRMLNSKSAPGCDDIHPVFLKEMSCFFILPWKLLFQKSLSSGDETNDGRSGIIVPIYKNNGKPNTASSYRPGSLTGNVCKLLERIIHKNMIVFLQILTEQRNYIRLSAARIQI